jgi:hypothetical protein
LIKVFEGPVLIGVEWLIASHSRKVDRIPIILLIFIDKTHEFSTIYQLLDPGLIVIERPLNQTNPLLL